MRSSVAWTSPHDGHEVRSPAMWAVARINFTSLCWPTFGLLRTPVLQVHSILHAPLHKASWLPTFTDCPILPLASCSFPWKMRTLQLTTSSVGGGGASQPRSLHPSIPRVLGAVYILGDEQGRQRKRGKGVGGEDREPETEKANGRWKHKYSHKKQPPEKGRERKAEPEWMALIPHVRLLLPVSKWLLQLSSGISARTEPLCVNNIPVWWESVEQALCVRVYNRLSDEVPASPAC